MLFMQFARHSIGVLVSYRRVFLAMILLSCVMPVSQSSAIELWTHYGDGTPNGDTSRIGLPSMEVPIEAYPGIPWPLRRSKNSRSWQPNRANHAVSNTITVRVEPIAAPLPTAKVPARSKK